MGGNSVVLVTASGVRSGAENVLASVARHLMDSGESVILVSPVGPVLDAFPAGIGHVAIDALGLGGQTGVARVLALFRVLANWARAGRTIRSVAVPGDAVVVNSLFALPAVPFAFPAGHRGVTTWLVHDTVVSRKQRIAVALGARWLTRAVAVSEVTAASVRPLVRDVVVRVNGVRIPVRSQTSEGDRRTRVIGILAALSPWKGHDVLLEAIALVPGAVLEIAGGDLPGEKAYVEALRVRAEREDLRGRVRFLGHVDRGDVLQRWDLAVSASVLPEAGPLGVLECMAAGVPVVASDHGGAAEYLAGGAGVLVPVGDPEALAREISELLGDPARLDALARIARRRVTERHDVGDTLPAMTMALTRP